MPHAAVDGTSLYYERHGAGEPVLLIQGMSGTHLAWGDAFLAGLGDGVDVVAYDHRGVGTSSPTDQPFTIAQLADDAAGLLDALELGARARGRASRWAAWWPRSSRCATRSGSAP